MGGQPEGTWENAAADGVNPAARPATSRLTLILDNEAAQALARVDHPKHRAVLAHLLAVSTRRRRGAPTAVQVPTAVRVEAQIDRRAPDVAPFNRFRVGDVALDSGAANRAAALRGHGGSVVEACVAVAALDAEAENGRIVALTADLTDIPRLLSAAGSAADVLRV